MSDDHNDGFGMDLPESLLPYDSWLETAYKAVMGKALAHAANNGLPGEHHFYITFKTTAPGVNIPSRLLAQYPDEMTIVLQHQFADLSVNQERQEMNVTLSFGGVASPLHIPFSAIIGFTDPYIHLAFRFSEPTIEATPEPEEIIPETPPGDAEVVSLAAFRKRPTS